MLTVRVTGLREAVARVERIGRDGLAAVPEATQAAARPIEQAWRAGVPVDTGRYQRSIHVERVGAETRIVTDVPYAKYVERGTSDTPAQPAARRGFEQGRAPAEQAAADVVRRRVGAR